MIEAIILAGGLGTRLAKTVPHLPKLLAPIQGVPFLHLLLKQLEKTQLFSKVVLALGHKASDVTSFLSREKTPFSLDFSIETEPLGTGGALLRALPKTSAETLLVMNGDSYFDIAFSSFLQFHREKKATISIASLQMEDSSRYGSLQVDPTSRVRSFLEKTSLPQAGWINGGIYLLQRSSLQSLPLRPCSIEKEIFPLFTDGKLFAFLQAGTFIDIGTQSSYFEAQNVLKPWIHE